MKKKIIALSAAIIMMTSISFAKGERPVPESIVSAFEYGFEEAENTQWITTNDYFKAVFTINKIVMEAFYEFDGDLVAVAKKLTIDQLPSPLLEKAKEKISTNRLSDIFQLTTDRGLEYFISFEKENVNMIYKSVANRWIQY